MFNFHTHTKRCGHAKGADEEYVLAAIENGYDTIGFSDHAPYVFPDGHESGFRVKRKDARDYVDSVHALQRKYKDKIDIKLGFELEYFPLLHEKEMEYLSQFDYDYLILGQHFTDNEYEPYAKYSGTKTDSVVTLDKYISQVILGAKSGVYTYVCHPDLINFTGDKDVYLKKMRYMLESLKKLDIPLEFNFYGFFEKRNYPNYDFWKLVAEIGNPVVIGLDAHWPEVYADKTNLELAHQYLASLGIKPLSSLEIK